MNFKQKISILCVGLVGLFLVPFLASAATLNWQQSGADGLGDSNNAAIYALEEFDGKLYAGTWNLTDGAKIYRTADLETWTLVNTPGFSPSKHTYIYDFQEFNGDLYVSTYNSIGGAVYRSSNGTDWTQVSHNGMGDANNTGIVKLYEAGGLLLAGTLNIVTGTELWYTANGTQWLQTATDGFGDINNSFVGNMMQFGNYLYVSTYNATTGAQIWRKPDGGTWAQSGSDGLGDTANLCFYGMQIVDDQLFIGSRRDGGAKMYTTTNGTAYTITATLESDQQNIRDIYYSEGNEPGTYLAVDNNNGTNILKSSANYTMTDKNSPGFGDVSNITSNQFAYFENSLVIGTAKSSGGAGEVWAADLRTPSKPADLRAPAKKRKVVSVKIKWDEATADKYYLKLMTKKGKKIKTFRKITNNYKVLTKKHLKSNKPYKVKVRAVLNNGEKSKFSKIKAFRTKPAKVRNVSVTNNTTVGGKDIAYDAVRGNDISYTIKVMDSNGDTVYTFMTDGATFFIPYLTPGDYQIKVRAKYNKNNIGKWSEIIYFSA